MLRDAKPLPLDQVQSLARAYLRTRSPVLESQLVAANLRLVHSMAFAYGAHGQDRDDLIQEGSLGLLSAVRKYDPSRGVKLSTYASWWIRAYQLRWVIANHRMVRVGTTVAQRKLFFNLRTVEAQLEHEGGAPTAERIAERLHVPLRDVLEMRERLGRRELSLDVSFDEDGVPLIDRLAGTADGPEAQAERDELRALLRREMERFCVGLPARERDLFASRWMEVEHESLGTIGRRYGVSRERARQIEAGVLARLKPRVARALTEAA